jgi:hypothetical protein
MIRTIWTEWGQEICTSLNRVPVTRCLVRLLVPPSCSYWILARQLIIVIFSCNYIAWFFSSNRSQDRTREEKYNSSFNYASLTSPKLNGIDRRYSFRSWVSVSLFPAGKSDRKFGCPFSPFHHLSSYSLPRTSALILLKFGIKRPQFAQKCQDANYGNQNSIYYEREHYLDTIY